MRDVETYKGFEIKHDDRPDGFGYDRYYGYEIDGKLQYGPMELYAIKKKIRAVERRRARPKREKINVPVHWIVTSDSKREVMNGFFRRVNGTTGELTLKDVEGETHQITRATLFPATLFSEDVVERYAMLLDTRDEIEREIREIEALGYQTPRAYAVSRDRAVQLEKEVADGLEKAAIDMEAYTDDE